MTFYQRLYLRGITKYVQYSHYEISYSARMELNHWSHWAPIVARLLPGDVRQSACICYNCTPTTVQPLLKCHFYE